MNVTLLLVGRAVAHSNAKGLRRRKRERHHDWQGISTLRLIKATSVCTCCGLKKKMREEENESALYYTVRVPQAHHSVLHRVAHTGVARRM